jgi:hypothetical protein
MILLLSDFSSPSGLVGSVFIEILLKHKRPSGKVFQNCLSHFGCSIDQQLVNHRFILVQTIDIGANSLSLCE